MMRFMNYASPMQPGQPPSNATPVYELSGWWARAGALIIDSVLVGVVSGFVGALVGISLFGPEGALDPSRESSEIDFTYGLLTLTVGAIYYCAIMTRTNGQTVGKQATGIRVVREDGEEMDVKFAFARQTLVIALLFNFLAAFALFIPTIINYLFPIWDDKNQALHDKIVKSRVVKAHPVMYQQYGPPVGYAAPAAPYAPPPPQPYAPPPPPPAPPSPPPANQPQPYTPPQDFVNPVPDDD